MFVYPKELQTDNVKLAKKIKQEILYLEPDKNPKHRERYCDARKRFIGHLEDQKKPNGTPWAYDDETGKTMKPGMKAKGKVTVGIGFNMSRGNNSTKEWNQAFGSLPKQERPSFDAVYKGEKPLEQKHIDMLFEVGITDREKRLIKKYKKNWKNFKPNERLAIESMHYNVESIVNPGTNFFDQINLYYDKKITNPMESKAALNIARWEIRLNSNQKRNRGIQDRRNSEEIMFDSFDSSLQMPQTKKEKHSKEIILKLNALEYGTLPADNMFSMLREAMMQAYKKGPSHLKHLMIGPNEDDYSKIDAVVESRVNSYKLSFANGYSQIIQKIHRELDRITNNSYSATYKDDITVLKKDLFEEHDKTVKKLYDNIQEKFQRDLEKMKLGKF